VVGPRLASREVNHPTVASLSAQWRGCRCTTPTMSEGIASTISQQGKQAIRTLRPASKSNRMIARPLTHVLSRPPRVNLRMKKYLCETYGRSGLPWVRGTQVGRGSFSFRTRAEMVGRNDLVNGIGCMTKGQESRST